MHILLKWLIMTVSVLLSAYLIPGVAVSGFFSALWVALVLGLINVLVRPVILLVTLPVNIITLGLFTFVINAVLILLVSSIVKGFTVQGFWSALFFSVVLSVINYVLSALVKAG